MSATMTLTADDYRAAFALEQAQTYPMVDALEAESGYALDRDRLEAAARVLACPVKKSPPNWQHGRVLYALTRKFLADYSCGWRNILDIGTAKGFSALCLQWALNDHAGASMCSGVTSVDVIDPQARVARKTIAEVNGLLTLHETLAPWPELGMTRFLRSTGIAWLASHWEQIHIAFVDGKHDGEIVRQEGRLLAERQSKGNLAIFDDVHIPDVAAAVATLSDAYNLRLLAVLPTRCYAIGVRR